MLFTTSKFCRPNVTSPCTTHIHIHSKILAILYTNFQFIVLMIYKPHLNLSMLIGFISFVHDIEI